MITRLILAGAVIAALGVPTAQAGDLRYSFLQCLFGGHALSKQCAAQFAKGNHNLARTDQTTTSRFGIQFAYTEQLGDNNESYIGQVGSNQIAVSVQKGNKNGSYTYQEGRNQASATVQSGDGHWGAVSSIGNGAVTSIVQTN